MRAQATICGTRVQTGAGTVTDVEELARALNDRVIRRLFAATLDLIDLAVTLDDPARIRELLGCVDHIDTAITQIRAAAFGSTADDRFPKVGPAA